LGVGIYIWENGLRVLEASEWVKRQTLPAAACRDVTAPRRVSPSPPSNAPILPTDPLDQSRFRSNWRCHCEARLARRSNLDPERSAALDCFAVARNDGWNWWGPSAACFTRTPQYPS
jgi:hypothetical protein